MISVYVFVDLIQVPFLSTEVAQVHATNTSNVRTSIDPMNTHVAARTDDTVVSIQILLLCFAQQTLLLALGTAPGGTGIRGQSRSTVLGQELFGVVAARAPRIVVAGVKVRLRFVEQCSELTIETLQGLVGGLALAVGTGETGRHHHRARLGFTPPGLVTVIADRRAAVATGRAEEAFGHLREAQQTGAHIGQSCVHKRTDLLHYLFDVQHGLLLPEQSQVRTRGRRRRRRRRSKRSRRSRNRSRRSRRSR
mmetsp:Transcript_12521/g.31776  ORF Transcript_12521/g.31776 Transcript_12521/m.31776 type:complete len:251 (+) Transcript_12521:2048-2800(+)